MADNFPGPLTRRIYLAAPMLEEVAEADLANGVIEGLAIERRRHENHMCVLCGTEARCAIVARPHIPPGMAPRWADLCVRDFYAVQAEVTAGRKPG